MRYFTIAVLLFLCSFANAQQNLVPNPSFEDTVYCPYGLNQIDACYGWNSYGLTPDYYNACSSTGMNVPNSVLGFQYAHSGYGMLGLAIYVDPSASSGPNTREFVGSQLIKSLVIGQKYFFSFYVNFSGAPNISIASNKMGLNFYTQTYSPVLNNNPKFFSDSILKDTLAWIKLEGSFIADSAYQYLYVGNFFTDQFTDTINTSITPYAAYYYVDDVCVSSDSVYNQLWTGLVERTIKDEIKLFPNPVTSILNVRANTAINSISIVDLYGKEVYRKEELEVISSVKTYNLYGLSEGMYIAIFTLKNKQTIQKRIILNP